jgi:hypothetical protein
MQTLRLFLILLLSLALPLAGYAGFAVGIEQCPMHASSEGVTEAMMDCMGCCEEDMQTKSKTGKACKFGQECKTSHSSQILIPKVFLSFIPTATSLFSPSHSRIISHDASGVWRPPSVSLLS